VSEQPGNVVRIERTFNASAEEVFDAWTDPEVLRRWFHCAFDWTTPEVEVDLRVGGTIRAVMRRPDGHEVDAHGTFTLIERPHRLTMIWVFGDEPSNEQLLDLSFSQSGSSTTVVLINSRISTDQRRDDQATGWHGCLSELERLLSTASPAGR
jgi:uncharacterized protein YndB with AHSA1/START domain